MGTIHAPLPVKLVIPLLTAQTASFEAARDALIVRYGPVDGIAGPIPFDLTDYYAREFGPGLQRWFLSFARLLDPGDLAAIKVATNELEASWSDGGRRRVNLDPGYLTQAKFVLATTKNQAHRIYLGRGIYAEVTLMYRDGAWLPLPWTYPDFRTPAYQEALTAIRRLLTLQLRAPTLA